MQKATTSPVNNVDAYLQVLPADMRRALEQLRQLILSAAPGAEEVISYGIPSYRLKGMLVGFGAAKNHCGFYVMSPGVMETFKTELAPYDTATSTIRFTPDKPLPVSLVKKIIAARIEENTAHREEADLRKKEKAKARKTKS